MGLRGEQILLTQAEWEKFSHTHRINETDIHLIDIGFKDGPLVILLHGFPDFWWGWHHQIAPLVEQGFRVIVPDGRGYNKSGKPQGLANYTLDELALDVIGIADKYGRSTFRLVGHDWGGVIALWTSSCFPQRVEQLVVINAPHPDVMAQVILRDPLQLLRSLYVLFFQLPRLPELLLKSGNYAPLWRAMTGSSNVGAFTPDEKAIYREAWAQPQALTSMLNYYRALRFKPLMAHQKTSRKVEMPTLFLWGENDKFLGREVAKASLEQCERGRIEFFQDATHWLPREMPEQVNTAIRNFFREQIA